MALGSRWRRRWIAVVVTPLAGALLSGCLGTSLPNIDAVSKEPSETISGSVAESLIQAGFASHDPDYRIHKAIFYPRLKALAGKLAAAQVAGNDMACSNQMYLEAQWLFQYATEWERLDRKLVQLDESLRDRDQAFVRRQSPETHLWGACYEEWFSQGEDALAWLDKFYEEDRAPTYGIQMPPRIATPAKMAAYIDSLVISDIAATGRDNREELANITTSLSRVFFKEHFHQFLLRRVAPRGAERQEYGPRGYVTIYEDFIRRWQDSQTGYWGAWYRVNGRIYKTPDLSMTYHIIAYRNGEVAYWPQIIDTTLRIKDDPYPFGWVHDGHFVNHNNYDVVRILKLGWPHMSPRQKSSAAAAIRDMLDWTLNNSLDPDGSFKLDLTFFSSIAAEYYFGIAFLDEAGYWDRGKRFWTEETFPNSGAICRLVRARLLRSGLQDFQALHALQRLDQHCGQM